MGRAEFSSNHRTHLPLPRQWTPLDSTADYLALKGPLILRVIVKLFLSIRTPIIGHVKDWKRYEYWPL